MHLFSINIPSFMASKEYISMHPNMVPKCSSHAFTVICFRNFNPEKKITWRFTIRIRKFKY